jgi:hypothetical protein
MRIVSFVSIPIPMRLIINTHGKLEEVYYGSQDRLMLALKSIRRKHRELMELNEKIILDKFDPTETK